MRGSPARRCVTNENSTCPPLLLSSYPFSPRQEFHPALFYKVPIIALWKCNHIWTGKSHIAERPATHPEGKLRALSRVSALISVFYPASLHLEESGERSARADGNSLTSAVIDRNRRASSLSLSLSLSLLRTVKSDKDRVSK